MKPIKLKFSGLQSYREEQEIDFEQLGGMGIFGIFGPTGGGKSTILDAITLALYGNIERAPNGTRGIMNHFEDVLSVSFEFILGKHHYIAERSYKRKKNDEAILNKVSRLLRIEGDNKEVLADKATEVTEKVEELLGMKFKDFTRAVIIPQNKFDEFLKLTEGDRTQMLEKIFCLEEYGEKLMEKVKKTERELDAAHKSNQNILLELGDASQEAVSKLEEELKNKKKEGAIKKKEEKNLQEKLKEMETAARIHKEMMDFRKEKERLEKKTHEIEENKRQLQAAIKAGGLKGPLNQINQLRKQIKQEEENLRKQELEGEQINQALEKAIIKLEEGKEKQKQVNLIKSEELPKLPLAISYEKDIKSLQEEGKKLENLIFTDTEALSKTEKAFSIKKESFEKMEEDIQLLKKKRIEMRNILQCRKEVDDGILLLISLEGEEKQESIALQQLEKKTKSLKKEKSALLKLLGTNLQVSLENENDIELDGLIKEVDKVLQEAIDRERLLQEAVEKLKDQNMARVLASKLEEGQPCQVCGSIHHPIPANAIELLEEDALNLEVKKATEAKEKVDDLRKWQQAVHIEYTKYQGTKREIETSLKPTHLDKLKEVKQVQEKFQEALTALHQKVRESLLDFDSNDRSAIKELKKQLEKADIEYQQVSKSIDEKEEMLKELAKEMTALKEEHTSLQGKIKGYKESIEKNHQRLEELTRDKRALIGDSTASAFEEKIKQQIYLFEKEIEDSQQLWEKVNKQKQEIQQVLTSLRTSIKTSITHKMTMEEDLRTSLIEAGFETIEELEKTLLTMEKQKEIEEKIINFENAYNHVVKSLASAEEKAARTPFDEQVFEESKLAYEAIVKAYNQIVREEGALQSNLTNLIDKQKRWKELQEKNIEILEKKHLVVTLMNLLRGKRFVKFLSEEHMRDIAIEASIRLGELTGQRYGLELDDKSSFIMRDEYNNNAGRLVTSLSGGETFLTSLALALALSSKIQLKGKPLGFFFLDEGFGTLDNEKLELVMNTLEKLQRDRRMVGIISHVDELKSRMPRYIEVTPASHKGNGSKIELKFN